MSSWDCYKETISCIPLHFPRRLNFICEKSLQTNQLTSYGQMYCNIKWQLQWSLHSHKGEWSRHICTWYIKWNPLVPLFSEWRFKGHLNQFDPNLDINYCSLKLLRPKKSSSAYKLLVWHWSNSGRYSILAHQVRNCPNFSIGSPNIVATMCRRLLLWSTWWLLWVLMKLFWVV